MKLKTLEQTRNKHLYFCAGCREFHYDRDYCEEDGDLKVLNLEKVLKSLSKIKEGEKE